MAITSYLRERARRKGVLDVASAVFRRFDLGRASAVLARAARRRYARQAAPSSIRTIQIETLAYCNLSCAWCPTNQISMPKGRMPETLFENLIGQLSEFDGTLGLYLRNEPLLDKRIAAFARRAKAATKARIVIQTNGTLLDEALAAELSDVAQIQVNDYSGGEELRRLAPLMKRHNIVGVDRSNPRGLSNRAGNLPGARVPTEPLKAFCVRPFEQIYVAYDGRVVLCCQDWRLEEVMGDASETPLHEIWRNATYARKRADLLACHRSGLCAQCDYPGV